MRRRHLPGGGAARILLIDDSAIEFAILRRILGNGTNWSMEWSRSGPEGLEILRRNPADWDLVMLDLSMPGMDGFEVLGILGNDPALRRLPVIVLTASSDRSDEVRALNAGAEEFLLKPLIPEIARARVRSVLELSRHRFDLENLVRERAAQLAHSDRLVSLGQLAAGMAHEINNPLTWISGNLQTLERCGPVLREELEAIPGWIASPRLEKLLSQFPEIAMEMRGGVKRVTRIVDGLKAFSRSGTGIRTRVALRGILRDARTLCVHALKGITIEFQPPEEVCYVLAESAEIEQVLINLLTNAADAVHEVDRPEGSEPGWIGVAICADADRVYLSVRDNGIGIPADLIDRLGTPFLTTKPPGKGTGLGLSISQGIVRSHGGELRALPCENGAFFLMELPRMPIDHEVSP